MQPYKIDTTLFLRAFQVQIGPYFCFFFCQFLVFFIISWTLCGTFGKQVSKYFKVFVIIPELDASFWRGVLKLYTYGSDLALCLSSLSSYFDFIYHRKPLGWQSMFFGFVMLPIVFEGKFSEILRNSVKILTIFRKFLFSNCFTVSHLSCFQFLLRQEDGYVMFLNLNCIIAKNPCFGNSFFRFDFSLEFPIYYFFYF